MNNEQSANIIKNLCKSKAITISTLLTDCNIRKSLIYDMEKRDKTPSANMLEKIADYVGCSVDYLIGRSDNPNGMIDAKDLSTDEKRLVAAYRNKPEMKSAVDKLLGLDDKVIQMDQPEKTYKIRSVARGGHITEFELDEQGLKDFEESAKKTDASDL